MKVCILANSAGFRMRPPSASEHQLTYAEIIERAGHTVRNVSKAGVMLNEAFAYLDDEVITALPDVVLVQFGAVEVCYRQTIRYFALAANRNYYMNRVLGRPYQFDTVGIRLSDLILRIINGLTRRLAGLFRVRWQWLPEKDLLEVFRATIKLLLKETRATILVAGIAPCSERVERILAGSGEKIRLTNQFLNALCLELGDRVQFFDTEVVVGANATELLPDGVHFSARGHELIGAALLRKLDQIQPQTTLSA